MKSTQNGDGKHAEISDIQSISQIRTQIAEIINSVLGEDISEFDTDQPLGSVVSSLQLVEGMRLVKERFDVNIPIIDLLSGQANLHTLTSYVEEAILLRQNAKTRGNTDSSQLVEKIKLPPARHHIEFLSRYSQGASAAYNEALVFHLEGKLEIDALKSAVLNLYEHFSILSGTLGDGLFVLDIRESKNELQMQDCTSEQLETCLSEIVKTPFSIESGIFKVTLLSLGKEEYVLVFLGHQLITDQNDLRYLMQELSVYYSNLVNTEKSIIKKSKSLPSAQIQLENKEDTETRRVVEEYWSSVFSEQFSYLNLPENFIRNPIKNYKGERFIAPLQADLKENLEEWVQNNNTSIFDTVLCAFNLMLHRLTAQNTILIGVGKDVTHANSLDNTYSSVNSIRPVHFSYAGELTFKNYLLHQKSNLNESEKHNSLALIDIVRIADIPRDLSRSGLVSAVFTSDKISRAPKFSELQSNLIIPPASGARYDIEMTLLHNESENSFQFFCDYDINLYKPEMISEWIEGIQNLLRVAIKNDDQKCFQLPAFSEKTRTLLLQQWNATETEYERNKTIEALVKLQIENRSNNLAIENDEQRLSYNDLDERIGHIATEIFGEGIRSGDRVAILMERTPDMLATMLAIWRLGAILVPLDPAFPEKRIQFMLTDSETQLLVVNKRFEKKAAKNTPNNILIIENLAPVANDISYVKYLECLEPSKYSHIIYTSGSTGQPKGVRLLHQGVVNTLSAVKKLFKFTEDSKWLAITTINFDISIVELFLPLISGGILNIAESEIAGDGIKLSAKIEACKPTHIQATPSTWKTLIQANWQDEKNYLNCIISTGEALSVELAQNLILYCPNLWNMYGPSETTIFSTAYNVDLNAKVNIKIGRPIANNTIYILDGFMQPVPFGAIGELYIGGDGVSGGYWKQAQLNKDFFVANPFTSKGLLYKTGDYVKYSSDGNLSYLGRKDHQIKKNGVRIELAEIESALKKNKYVKDAVVIAWKSPKQQESFVAHLVLFDGYELSSQEIRQELSQWLPAVMIPSYYIFHFDFPLTPNKKIDRNKLPNPYIDNASVSVDYEKPETETEISLARIWATVLGLQENLIDRNGDFISLGGHSLLMTPLMVEVKKTFNVQFTLQEFFNAKTLREFANLIDRQIGRDSKELEELLRSEESRKAEWAKQRMAFLEREAQLPVNLTPARGMEYSKPEKINKVFLTGATGFLGAFILGDILRSSDAVVYCLVRPKRGQIAKQRIEKQLRDFNIWDDSEYWNQAWNTRVNVVEGDISLPRMGITDTSYSSLAYESDVIIHSAAQVNFIYPYEAISASNVRGVQEIIRFAFFNRIKQVHFLSTAAIWPMGAGVTYYETDTIDHGKQLRLGYYEAKWVAEKCLLEAESRGLPVTIHRPGEIGGDSEHGKCILEHFMIALTKGFLQVGAFPIIDSVLDVAPVDYVAQAIVYLVFHGNTIGKSFHLTNPNSCHMKEATLFLKELGYNFEELQFSKLRERLLNLEEFSDNALFPFQATLESMHEEHLQLPNYDCQQTLKELQGSGISCPPLDKKLLGTYINYLQSIGYIPLPN